MIFGFILISFIGLVMIFITTVIIYEMFKNVWSFLPKLTVPKHLRLMFVIIPIFTAHIINIWLYGFAYLLIENFTSMGTIIGPSKAAGFNISAFLDSLYFSSVNYTTLGFGDFIASGNLRMLATTEALNGLVLMGWTISFTYLVMEDFWKMPKHKPLSK